LKSRIVKNCGLKDSAYIVGGNAQRRLPSSVIFPSIYLNGQGFFLIFPASSVYHRHKLSLVIPLVDSRYCRASISSDTDSRAWRMISFWVATPFWVLSLHAQPVLPATPKIPLELKGDRSRVTLFQGGTSFICELPAAHGLGAICSASPWFSTHAALVSLEKKRPTEHTNGENTERGLFVHVHIFISNFTAPGVRPEWSNQHIVPPGSFFLSFAMKIATKARRHKGTPKGLLVKKLSAPSLGVLVVTFYYKKKKETQS